MFDLNSLSDNNKKLIIMFPLILLFILSIVFIYFVNRTGETDDKQLYGYDFNGVPGIIAGAEMFSGVNGQKIVHIRVKNISDKNINRIIMYFKSENTGDETKSNFVIMYDNTVEAGSSEKYVYEFTDAEADKIELYIYNICYDDDSEWGNENASEQNIFKESYKLNIINVKDK